MVVLGDFASRVCPFGGRAGYEADRSRQTHVGVIECTGYLPCARAKSAEGPVKRRELLGAVIASGTAS